MQNSDFNATYSESTSFRFVVVGVDRQHTTSVVGWKTYAEAKQALTDSFPSFDILPLHGVRILQTF